MCYSVMRLENKPIVVVQITGALNACAHFQIAKRCAELFDWRVGKVYLVIDLTRANLELMDTVDMLDQMTKGWAGTASDMRVISMMVLKGGNASLVAGYLTRGWEGWRRVFIFPSLAQALACACGPILYESEEAMFPAHWSGPISEA